MYHDSALFIVTHSFPFRYGSLISYHSLADAFLADLDDLEEEENQETQQVTANEQVPTNEVKEEELGENESEDMESENEEEVRFRSFRYGIGRGTH